MKKVFKLKFQSTHLTCFQRAKVKLLKEHLKSDWNIKDVNYNTNYNSEYYAKQASKDMNDAAPNKLHLEKTNYLRTVQERVLFLL